jgi:hypothetical protein
MNTQLLQQAVEARQFKTPRIENAIVEFAVSFVTVDVCGADANAVAQYVRKLEATIASLESALQQQPEPVADLIEKLPAVRDMKGGSTHPDNLSWWRLGFKECREQAAQLARIAPPALQQQEGKGEAVAEVRSHMALGKDTTMLCRLPAGYDLPAGTLLYASPSTAVRQEAGSGWKPIESAPRDVNAIFWVVPKTAEEAYFNTSGDPIVSRMKPRMAAGIKYGQWSSLEKAILWAPLPAAPTQQPPSGSDGGKEQQLTDAALLRGMRWARERAIQELVRISANGTLDDNARYGAAAVADELRRVNASLQPPSCGGEGGKGENDADR